MKEILIKDYVEDKHYNRNYIKNLATVQMVN